jgi:hypothetical protein
MLAQRFRPPISKGVTMALTDVRPTTDPAPGPSEANAGHTGSAAPGRPGVLLRRLPYALLVVGLAVGYLLGQSAAPSAPKAAGSGSAAVTPQQISQALSGTAAAGTAVNDRGFGQLENGVQHSHGFELPVSPADRTLLAHQLVLARDAALRYPTLADAERAGLHRAGPFSPGLGTHMIDYANYANGAGNSVLTDAQIAQPLAWIYDGTKSDSPVVGLFYSATVPNPVGFAGPNDVWHQHHNICLTQSATSGVDAPLGADRDVTVAQCDAVHGSLLKATGPLLHAWVVPGYDDPQGVFAHLNPAVTCDDGTYHVVDESKLGTRLTACVDGTE